MVKKIYIGNLTFETTDADLNDMFSQLDRLNPCKSSGIVTPDVQKDLVS